MIALQGLTCTDEASFAQFLAWKATKYGGRAPDTPAARSDVSVEMEPVVTSTAGVPVPDHSKEEHSQAEEMKEKIDREAFDSTFLNLTRERVQASFAWRDVSFTVPVKKGHLFNLVELKTGETKDILSQVSGFSRPGEILFVMGPSGAGKSTMLDALADRVKLPVAGVQWLDGKRKTETNLRLVSKYVQQDDCMMGALTVREVMNTAAALYVKESDKRDPLITATLKMVGLTEQSNTKVRRERKKTNLSCISHSKKVGDVFFRGLSGGQRRRLSIAIELLAQPSILFLDEPTSGLDSAAAFAIMASLRKVAKATSTNLIVTIHQPSELLFELGDNLLLLSGGRQVYFGPISNVESHFNTIGFSCPRRTSIAEWLLDLVNQDFGSLEVVNKCVAGWKGSEAQLALAATLDEMKVPKSAAEAGQLESAPFVQHYPVGQVSELRWTIFFVF